MKGKQTHKGWKERKRGRRGERQAGPSVYQHAPECPQQRGLQARLKPAAGNSMQGFRVGSRKKLVWVTAASSWNLGAEPG